MGKREGRREKKGGRREEGMQGQGGETKNGREEGEENGKVHVR